MAHIPLIHGPDGAKLSKRHGALGVEAYREMGYLPEALRNYLVRLGWAHGDQEVFSTQEMTEAFDLPQIGRSPARFDFAKLENLNGIYLRQSEDARLLEALEAILPQIGPERGLSAPLSPDLREKFLAAMPGLKERAKTLVELLDSASFLYAERPLQLDAKAAKILDADASARLAAILPRLEAIADWNVESTEAAVARPCGGDGDQARADRPAPARRAHRQGHVAGIVRRDGGSGPGGMPRPDRRPDHGLNAALHNQPAAL